MASKDYTNDAKMVELYKTYGESMRNFALRPDLQRYVSEEARKIGTNPLYFLAPVLMLLDMAYNPDFPRNIRLTGLTEEELIRSKRTLTMALNLRKVYPERPDFLEFLEYMRDHGRLDGFL